jgi:membrane protein
MSEPFRCAVRYFYRHDGFFLAAGLSFYVVVCIVPLVLLIVAAGGFLLSDEQVVGEVLDRLATVLPVYQTEMERMLMGVVRARGVSSLVGTAILLLFATQLFAATRLVLNRIFAVKGRGFLHGVLFDVAMIAVLAVLFFVTIGITGVFVWLRRALELVEHGLLAATLVEWAGLLLAVFLDTLLFVVLYRFVPSVRHPWRSVILGSTATAALWELAKQLFRLYIEGVGLYSTVYGSLGVAIALVMWVYYSAIVFVLGAALIRGLEEGKAAAPRFDAAVGPHL